MNPDFDIRLGHLEMGVSSTGVSVRLRVAV